MRIDTAMPGTVASNDSATERDEGLSSVNIRVGVAKRPQALLQAPVHFHAVLKMRTITTASSQVGVIHFRNEEVVSSFPHIRTAAGGKANAQHPEHMRLQLSSSPSCPATKGATPGCHRRTRRQSHQINRRDSARHQAASACQRCPNDLSDLLP